MNNIVKKKVVLIILIVTVSALLFGTVDYVRAKSGRQPIFVYHQENINSKDELVATAYYGIGYKIVVCDNCGAEDVIFMPLGIGSYAWFIGDESDVEFAISIEESNDIILKALANSYIESGENISAKIYSYGLDEIKVTKNGRTYLLEEALRLNKLTIEEIIEKLEYDTTICYCNGRKEIALDEGYILYTSQTYSINFLKCNTSEGNKNIYIGSNSMKYEKSFCK